MKEAGNRAFRGGRYAVAAANYNGALEMMARNCRTGYRLSNNCPPRHPHAF
jgi:hypothetical protein